MKKSDFRGLKREVGFGLTIVIWIVTIWLLYPLINLDSVNMENAKEYLYRASMGTVIMIIFLGKTIFDLLFPQVTLRKTPLLNTIFLTVYAIALGGGIIFMVARIITLYLKSQKSGFIF